MVKTNRLDDLPTTRTWPAVGLLRDVTSTPTLGAYQQMRPPVKFAETPSNIRRHPPQLGEHTDEVLSDAVSPPELSTTRFIVVRESHIRAA